MAFVSGALVRIVREEAVTCRTVSPWRTPVARRGRVAYMMPSPNSPEESENVDRKPEEEETKGDEVAPAESELVVEEEAPAEEAAEEEVEDVLASPAMLRKRIEILQGQLDEAKAKQEETEKALEAEKDSMMRVAAEYDNYRRRSAGELLDANDNAVTSITREFLNVLDSFERAATSVVPETERETKINNAYQSINKVFIKTLQKLQVEPIDSVGEPFDANIHEAIQQQGSTEYKEGVVMIQLQRGYKIGDRLIRPCMCIVSEGPGPDEPAGGEDNGSSEQAESTEPATVNVQEP